MIIIEDLKGDVDIEAVIFGAATVFPEEKHIIAVEPIG